MIQIAKCVCVLGLALQLCAYCQADTLSVANNGVDSLTCGTHGNPCRSIRQAIHNAVNGDTILVGPGHYGDVDNDGTFTSPGDEAAEVGSGCFCILNVDKSVTILSQGGADVTVLDAGGLTVRAVWIQASGVTFGGRGKGFTVRGAGGDGLAFRSIEHVTISGNRFTDNTGDGLEAEDCRSGLIIGNVASGNGGRGFSIDGPTNSIIGNVATANASVGFFVFSLSANTTIAGNVATDDPGGLGVAGDAVMNCHGNAFIGNARDGLSTDNNQIIIERNDLFGNASGCAINGDALSAKHNYFGAATGPGTAPANDVCGTDPTIATPFATKPIKVKPILP